MRVKVLRQEDDNTVRLVYPSTLREYREAIEPLGRPARAAGNGHFDADQARSGPAGRSFVVTTAEQRHLWELPDLTATGRARVVDEERAFALLGNGMAPSEAADEPSAAAAAETPPDGRSCSAALEALRALVTPSADVERMLGSLQDAGLPRAVRKTLRRDIRRALASQSQALDAALERAGRGLDLPWRTREPERFDRAHLQQALDRTHGGLAQVKTRLIEALAACPQTRGPLTVEGLRHGRGADADAPAALVVRPDLPREPAPVPCLAGPRGTGKTTLALAVAGALGRRHVRVPLDMANPAPEIRGLAGRTAGRIIRGLRETGVGNPVFILESVDRVEKGDADALLDLLDPARCRAFRDACLDVPFDLRGVVWIVTATDAGAIPKPVRERLEVIELPAYTEQEKLAIAQRHLLARPFDGPGPESAGRLALAPTAPPAAGPRVAPSGPAVLMDREVSSLRALEGLPAGIPATDGADAWRTAASAGEVRFEPEAIRRVIRDHTSEAGVADLTTKLATICREVVRRRPSGSREPEVVTPAVVSEVLGDGDPLPPAVREAVARERRRLGDSSDGDAPPANDWIEWLQGLPWRRRAEAPIELAQVRAALDAGHAGLGHAKACILEYLAVRRRNRRGSAVLCFAGPPGVGKTSLAQCVAEALGRGFAKLACGGVRDETDLRGHNKTWKDAQPGWILREMRRVGSCDPVFVLDEIDKLGDAPAAVLLEVLDPAQHACFRDAFVELPFDLSEVLFITTANEPDRIPPALRDRLEIIDLPGYSEAEKLAIAQTHLVGAQNRAAGLADAPVRFTRGACRQIIRGYTSERGIRQFARCLQRICRKVALGIETGDASLVRRRITVRQVRAFLGEPAADPTDGLVRLREQFDALALPPAVRARARQVLERLSAWAPTDPDHARAREYLQCLLGLPWARRSAPSDLSRARAVLDAGHAGHGAAKERLLDYVAGRLANRDAPSPVLCLAGPPGVGKTSLARLVAAALGRPCAWVPCGALGDPAALCGARSGPPGRIVDELRRVGVRNPVFVLDEIDRLDEAGGTAAALLEALDPAPGAAFRDRYLDLPFDLSEAVFVATATLVGRVPAMLRERMRVVELPGYTDQEKRVIATRHLWPLQLALHGLEAGQVEVTGEAVDALIRGYTREAGVWRLAGALGEVCAKVVRRRAEGDESPVEVTPQTLAGMLGAPAPAGEEVAGRAGRPGVAVGLCRTMAGGGDVICIEAVRMPGAGALTLSGRVGEVMQESARTALSWLRANAQRYGLDAAFHREADLHLHVQSSAAHNDGASAGVTMAAALVAACTGRAIREDLAMTGEITLSGQVLPVGGIQEKVLAAHRCGLARVVLPRENRKQVDEDLGDDLRRAVEVHYVTRIDGVLELALRPAPAAGGVAAVPVAEPAS